MNLLNKLERKLEWLAFPGFFKCLTILGAVVYAISWTQPQFGLLIDFNKARILEGEWWRVATFLFASKAVGFSLISLLFLICAVSFAFLISDALERTWGTTRSTLFLLSGWLFLLIGAWFTPAALGFPGGYFYSAVFLAFAWYHPDFIIRLFGILPVPCHLLAKLDLAFLLVTAMMRPAVVPFLLIAHLNLLVWVGPELWKSRKLLFQARAKRREFQSKLRPVREAFHTCSVCQRTEHHVPALDFRVGRDGQEYCDEHLPQ